MMDENFIQHINQEDDLQVAARCHLILEYYLKQIIYLKLPKPDELDLDRVQFKYLVELAIALDGIDIDKKGLLLRLNKIRNGYAHDIGTHIDDRQINELMSLLSEYDKNFLRERKFDTMSNAQKLGGVYLTIYGYLTAIYERLQETA